MDLLGKPVWQQRRQQRRQQLQLQRPRLLRQEVVELKGKQAVMELLLLLCRPQLLQLPSRQRPQQQPEGAWHLLCVVQAVAQQ